MTQHSSAALEPSPIKVDRVPAGSDVDTATKRTIGMMAAYIRESASDPLIQRCAQFAFDRFGRGVNTDAAKCWAVFWWVKHCVRFRTDESVMFNLGAPGEQDVLIAPSLLVRFKHPAEDCDGFTMLGACLLHVLGVPVVLTAVAVNPSRPEVWSHVFPMALCDCGVQPLDMSHGSKPGWMVPLSRISRWQSFDLNGEPVNVKPTSFQGLHGLGTSRVPMRIKVPRIKQRGLGEDDSTFNIFDPGGGGGGPVPGWSAGASSGSMLDPSIGVTQDANGNWLNSSGLPTDFGYGVDSPGHRSPDWSPGTSNAGSSSSWLSSLLNNSFNLAGKVLAPTYQSCNQLTGVCTTIRSGSTNQSGLLTAAAVPGAQSSGLLIIGIVVLAGVALMASKK